MINKSPFKNIKYNLMNKEVNNNYDYTHILVTFIKPSYRRYKRTVKSGWNYLIGSTFFYNSDNIKIESETLTKYLEDMNIPKLYFINVMHLNEFKYDILFESEKIEAINVSWYSFFLEKHIHELLFDMKYRNEYVFFNFQVNSWNELLGKFNSARILISSGGSTKRYHKLSTIHFKMSIFLNWMLNNYGNKLDIIDGSFYSFNHNKVIKRSLVNYFNKEKMERNYKNSFNIFTKSLIDKIRIDIEEVKPYETLLKKYGGKEELIDKLLKEHYDKKE